MRLLRHRRLLGLLALAAAGLAIAAFVLAYFEPQKLFVDDRVAEALPAAATVKTLSARTLSSYGARTTGRAHMLATAGGRRYVRFEDFETSNGPALKVYLSVAPASGPGDHFDDRFVDLGEPEGQTSATRTTRSRPVCASIATAAWSCGASASQRSLRRRDVRGLCGPHAPRPWRATSRSISASRRSSTTRRAGSSSCQATISRAPCSNGIVAT